MAGRRGLLLAVLLWGCGGEAPPPQRPAAPPAEPAAPAPVAPAEPPAPPGPSPIAGDLPVVDVADLEAAGASSCPPDCRADEAMAQQLAEVQADATAHEGATAGPLALASFVVLREGGSLVVARHEHVDLLGLVLSGRASVALAEGPRAGQTLEPWTAFLLPEGGANLRADGDAPAALAIVRAADSPGALAHPARRAGRRPRGGLVTQAVGELPDLAWAGGAFHARIAFEAPSSPRASLGVLIGSANAPVPEHDHPTSWEVLSAVTASGNLHIPGQPVPAGADGATVAEHDRPVGNGKVVLVPTAVRHGWRPDGSRPLVAVQSYAPPGPEQRFRTLASPPPPSP